LFRRTWQSPSNAHAYRLYIFNEPARPGSFSPPSLAASAAISEALDYDRFERDLTNSEVFTHFAGRRSPLRFALSVKTHIVARFGRSHQCSLRSGSRSTDENAPSVDGAPRYNSLTMSYFHTGTRTIIGAEAFHCPVRDGKEWDHLAMVIRHNFLPCSLVGCKANS
jgi:hypothetical protein